MISKYFTVLLVNKTNFSSPCHALKNSVAVKGLNKACAWFLEIAFMQGCMCVYASEAINN